MGSPATKAGSQSLMALCNSFKWPHFGSLNKPDEATEEKFNQIGTAEYIITKYILF
jgi:hypothetical protein